ncbi:MAG: energy-coupling factor transporter transmembrane protein EcfT [Acidaminococcales bacterium]|jgi:energy-coupling factor transport system permease protein|nr:energy-coupling factor transporter transmembrane protein EcfT [Acidaminococcales bacterium]
MLGNITFGQYFPGDTPVHKLDPRTKIILTIIVIAATFTAADFWAYSLLTAFFVFVTALGRLSFVRLLRSVKPLWPIILITFFVHVFSGQGETLFRLFIFKITGAGLTQGILMSLRLVFLILFSSLMTMTTSPLELTDGLERLLRPFRRIGLPAHELAMMMTIALRFIPTLLQETERIMMAQSARGADFKSGGLTRKARNILTLIVPLFLSAFRRADELATAMEARCYHGGEGRTRMHELALAKSDALAALIVVFLAAVLAFIKWCG